MRNIDLKRVDPILVPISILRYHTQTKTESISTRHECLQGGP